MLKKIRMHRSNRLTQILESDEHKYTEYSESLISKYKED